MRYIKVRPGDEAALKKGIWKQQNRKGELPEDAISVSNAENVIIDHVSTSWTTDEVLSVSNSKNVTIQWSIITEPLSNPKLHIENEVEQEHAFGSLMNGENISYIKNVMSNFVIRGPQMGTTNQVDKTFFIKLLTTNNIIAFFERSGTRVKLYNNQSVNYAITNNIYMYPINQKAPPIILEYSTDPVVDKKSKIFISGNILPDKIKQDDNSWRGVYLSNVDKEDAEDIKVSNIPFDSPKYLNHLPAEKVIEHILPTVGSSLPSRDSIDTRIINQIKTGKDGKIIAGQDDVGGYKENKPNSPNSSSELIRCKSSGHKFTFCSISNSNVNPLNINLLKQISTSECIKNRTFGIKENKIFVDKGCEGDFEVTLSSNSEIIRCKSSGLKFTNCTISSNNRNPSTINLIKQISTSACIKNRTFGIKENKIFVDKGCEGDFEVEF